MFDEGEYTCFAKYAKGTKVFPVSDHANVLNWVQYFTINPLCKDKDLNPTEEYHDKNSPRRADANVIAYRNFLIEIDNTGIQDQYSFIREFDVPYSTLVYSGGKSLHFIVSLENECKDLEEYTKLAYRFYKALNVCRPGLIDSANKNPSRLSRFPSVKRESNGKEQMLCQVNKRVEKADFEAWIDSKIGTEVETYKNPVNSTSYYNYIRRSREKYGLSSFKSSLSGFTLNLLMVGAEKGNRNTSVFKAACDFARCGYSEDEAFDKIIEVIDLSNEEITRTIKSAYNKVEL